MQCTLAGTEELVTDSWYFMHWWWHFIQTKEAYPSRIFLKLSAMWWSSRTNQILKDKRQKLPLLKKKESKAVWYMKKAHKQSSCSEVSSNISRSSSPSYSSSSKGKALYQCCQIPRKPSYYWHCRRQWPPFCLPSPTQRRVLGGQPLNLFSY